jgi:SPOR domain
MAMYDTRWPRPGPAMAAVAALVGLVAGIVLGYSSGGPEPTAQAGTASETSTRPPARTLPDDFYTVVLHSERDRAVARDRAARLTDQGVPDVAVLHSDDFPTLTPGYYVVYSGRFPNEERARTHLGELTSQWPALAGGYVRRAAVRA